MKVCCSCIDFKQRRSPLRPEGSTIAIVIEPLTGRAAGVTNYTNRGARRGEHRVARSIQNKPLPP